VASSSESAIVGAGSASNAWVFASVGLGPRTEALHWNGAAWDSVCWIPGGGSLWAPGLAGSAKGTRGVILKYGP
jgi:hypothetical protein